VCPQRVSCSASIPAKAPDPGVYTFSSIDSITTRVLLPSHGRQQVAMRPCPDTPFPRWSSFERYSRNEPTPILDPKSFNPITCCDDCKASFPSLHLYAFDTLAIPAISAECERVFSSTKKFISPERNRLAVDIIEASECLKNWWDHGLIYQLADD
jgi:hypothetical protein